MGTTLAVDCMGGDHGCAVTVPAVFQFLTHYAANHPSKPPARVLLCGDQEVIRAHWPKGTRHQALLAHAVEIVHTTEFIAMDDSVEVALRKKRQSSLHLALRAVKDGRAAACISAGNTGALMAIARYVLKTLAEIERPALCAPMPNRLGKATYVLDLGANIDCSALQLHQFAIMGSIFATASEGIRPQVGLMNVGTEIIKGSEVIKETYWRLQAAHEAGQIQFFGYVEGNDIFDGKLDVIVCDGFAGNVALKAVEGLGQMVKETMRQEFTRSLTTRLAALFAYPVLQRLRRQLSPMQYNGACLLGLNGLVYKSHGGADIDGFHNALQRAARAVDSQLQPTLHEQIHQVFGVAPKPITSA